MFSHNDEMVDRLRNREQFDRWVFLGFAIGGSALIWLAKYASVDALLVALGAMAVMVGYAVLVHLGPKLKLRADQLGDNCYYMGLVFTLASLSYAIFTFDPAKTATTIVQGFGVALASTVLGLVLRVFFSQGQPDLAMAEDNARLALTATAAQVRAELDGVVLAFQSFATQTQQHLVELRDQVRSDVDAIGLTAQKSITKTVEDAGQALAKHSAETTRGLTQVSASTQKLVTALDGHAEAIKAVAEKTSGQLEALKAIESAGSAAASALSRISASATAIEASQASLDANGDKLAAASQAIALSTTSLLEAAQRFDDLVEARLTTLNKAPMKVSEKLSTALADTVTKWEETITRHTKSHVEFLQSLEKARADELEAVKRHNQALDTEVAQSRSKVTKVHNALVDMTNELASQVSAAAS